MNGIIKDRASTFCVLSPNKHEFEPTENNNEEHDYRKQIKVLNSREEIS